MNGHRPGDIRNIAIVGHAAAGKTMLAEAMLMCSGNIHRMGTIAQGSTVSDYHVGEQQRHISIHGTSLNCGWQGRRFNFIDTPGYLDFSSEAINALNVADLALVVVNASHGIGVGTELMWEYASTYGLPKIIVVTGLDKEKADFAGLLANIRSRFGPEVFPLQVPMDPGPGFHQVLDVLRSEVVSYAADRSGKYREELAQGEWKEKVNVLHQELVEHIAESDNALLEKFLRRVGWPKMSCAPACIPPCSSRCSCRCSVPRVRPTSASPGLWISSPNMARPPTTVRRSAPPPPRPASLVWSASMGRSPWPSCSRPSRIR